jgi:hypothetical protein
MPTANVMIARTEKAGDFNICRKAKRKSFMLS